MIELSSADNNKVSFAPLNENKAVRNVAMKECVTSSKRKIIALEPGTLRAREYSAWLETRCSALSARRPNWNCD